MADSPRPYESSAKTSNFRDHGLLDVADGNRVYWEATGNPAGRPALVLHGGPGSGCGRWWSELFDQGEYRVVLMDQRGCGRSLPNAGHPDTDLSTNTTAHLLSDIERLREYLGIEGWLLLGGSWGSTLALAYATAHPDRVTGLVLFSVTTTTAREVAWATRGIGRFLPAEWERFRGVVPDAERDGDLSAAYGRLLSHEDPSIRARAAREWCRWDDAQMRAGSARPPDPRFEDPAFRLCFARLVTHYWSHAAWLPEDWALERIDSVTHLPAVMIHGRRDLGAPPEVAWRLAEAWPAARLRILDDVGHGGGSAMTDAVRSATEEFLSAPSDPTRARPGRSSR
jgi:proline iminopeptidase